MRRLTALLAALVAAIAIAATPKKMT